MPSNNEPVWACPKCGAPPNACGKGDCLSHGENCCGLLCECDSDSNEGVSHGTLADTCPLANCYHCGWGGKYPVKPKGLLPWEKRALELGWIMPDARADELGIGTNKMGM